MSEQDNTKKLFKIEDVVCDKLTGDAQKNLLDFAAFLHANEISLNPNDDGTGWAVGKGTVGGYLILGGEEFPGPWTLWFNSCDFKDNGTANDELKETAWTHTSPCGKCNANWEKCGGGDRIVFGRKFERRCHSPMMFTNPDAKTLEHAKKLLLMLK